MNFKFSWNKFSWELYDICNSLYTNVNDLNIRAKEIRVTLEEKSVRELVEEAEESNYDSEDIHYFKELLNGKYHDFLRVQLKPKVNFRR